MDVLTSKLLTPMVLGIAAIVMMTLWWTCSDASAGSSGTDGCDSESGDGGGDGGGD